MALKSGLREFGNNQNYSPKPEGRFASLRFIWSSGERLFALSALPGLESSSLQSATIKVLTRIKTIRRDIFRKTDEALVGKVSLLRSDSCGVARSAITVIQYNRMR